MGSPISLLVVADVDDGCIVGKHVVFFSVGQFIQREDDVGHSGLIEYLDFSAIGDEQGSDEDDGNSEADEQCVEKCFNSFHDYSLNR